MSIRLRKKKNLKLLSRPINKEILNVKSFEFKIFKKEIEKIFRLKKNNDLENLLIKCLKYYTKFEQLDSKSSSMKKSIKEKLQLKQNLQLHFPRL